MMGRFELEKTSSLDTWSIFDTHGAGLRGHRAEAIELRDLLLREFPVEGEQQPAEPAPDVHGDESSAADQDAALYAACSRVGLVPQADVQAQIDAARAEERQIADARVVAARQDEREACVKCIPTTWLDPLLTGKDAVIPSDWSSFDAESLQHLMLAIINRIRARAKGEP